LLRKGPIGPKLLERLMDEAYLLILTQRPGSTGLARELGISKQDLDPVLRKLSNEIKRSDLRVVSSRGGKEIVLQIQALRSPGKPVEIGPDTLKVRKMPPRRSGLKPEDLIIYAREW